MPTHLFIEAQEELPGCPPPPGLRPYHLEVVETRRDDHVHTGVFAPSDWLEALATSGPQRFRDWVALALMESEPNDGDEDNEEGAALCLDAWAGGEPVKVSFATPAGTVRHDWEPDNEALVDRAARARAEREALKEAGRLEVVLPEIATTGRSGPRM